MFKTTVTPSIVERYLEQIRTLANENDYEAAHGREDGLRALVLESIASGVCTDPRECARLALSSDKIKFQRRLG